jgi:CelD/BcsL family acetyltransferase involved in cellulose biosynthesis
MRLYVVRDEDGRLVAVAPMMRTTVHVARVPLLRVTQFIGTDPNLTEVRGMLVHPSEEAAAVGALASTLERKVRDSWILWCGLRRSESGLESLRGVWPAAVVTKDTPAFILQLPSSWEELRARLPRNIRESLRKCYNSLARDKHEWKFNVVTSPPALVPALEKLIEMHGRRASAAGTVQHRNCFDTDSRRAFIYDVAERFSRRSRVCVFQLEIAGEIVATRLAFISPKGMYLYYSGYEPAWARYSVMTTVVAEAIKYAINEGMTFVNLSTWPDESKLRWRPDEVHFLDVACVRSSPVARAKYRLLHSDVRDRLKRRILRD